MEKVLKLADLAHRKADGLLTLRDFAGYDCYEADAAEVPTLSESQIDRPIAYPMENGWTVYTWGDDSALKTVLVPPRDSGILGVCSLSEGPDAVEACLKQ